jgi:hypothetical protein
VNELRVSLVCQTCVRCRSVSLCVPVRVSVATFYTLGVSRDIGHANTQNSSGHTFDTVIWQCLLLLPAHQGAASVRALETTHTTSTPNRTASYGRCHALTFSQPWCFANSDKHWQITVEFDQGGKEHRSQGNLRQSSLSNVCHYCSVRLGGLPSHWVSFLRAFREWGVRACSA